MTDKAKKMGINIIQSQQENNPLFDMLLKNFPQTIKDNQVSLSAIKMLLGFNESMHDISGYELTWTGKGLANALYSEPCQKQLKLQESFTPQTLASKHPNNAIIIGDNLDALKLLKSAYSEKIKMIYIDPPYNTKSDDFIYPDNFRRDYQKILREVGLMEIDENGEEIESESLKFFKNTQGSGTHSGWLSFMLPRLKLARDLLKEDGVIFISVDDNECANLKILCDEIFGEDNFVACAVWHKKDNASFLGKDIIDLLEYVLIYKKSASFNGTTDCLIDTEKHRELITKPSKIGERIFKKDCCLIENGDFTGLLEKGSYGSKQFCMEILEDVEIICGIPKNDIKIKGRFCWTQSSLDNEILKGGRIEIKSIKGMKPIFYKNFDDSIPFRPMRNLLSKKIEKDVATNNDAANEIKEIFDNLPLFEYPKPSKLIKKFIRNVTDTNSNDIILDFFAGSGTTAHAVMELNAEDEGNREFILVQIDEEIKEDKSAYDFCKKELKSAKPVISDITIERVKRAAQKIIESSKDGGLDLGFKVYTLEDKAQITNDKEEITLFNHSILTPFDKALNLALQCGKTLNQPLEIIIKDKLYKCEDAYFCIVCDKEAQEHLAKSKNEMIFLDGYEEIDLEAFLNLNASFKERLSMVY
ncbi:site-specific DNA-methyltransferase [Helicobacter pylori]|uniref:site-specific DNA-methyltransferase n=1 Tax=Helicobacter pylori TaxID=210 RepID=UPI00025AC5F4|nr:site-specific DNA-methyltransferase [Helicobacter pylori]EIE27856.1 adenine specific DNA methyltransferase [Helicobacter pylori NCTC 11637 = CCUG 17874 = ATCC 43504 = JCM 12093]MBM0603100.1 site-specific DNA-methyltransferase [Helicobacter pylori]MBM0610452.1 site-specific DNA-methyltransferase [Helicobacter pylori]MBM0619198.1 site-specific DNA-methyltransferase [Helicobacter pylori]MBM0626448.1 site-specific DNA-methyltransferase [Helicobacter pylori]